MGTIRFLRSSDPSNKSSQFLLILGKPGGGKGTISGKILKVSIGDLSYLEYKRCHRAPDDAELKQLTLAHLMSGFPPVPSRVHRRLAATACSRINTSWKGSKGIHGSWRIGS